MKIFLVLVAMFYSIAVAAFDVTEGKFPAPDPAALCTSNEAMFGGASIIYSDCAKNIENVIVSKIESNRSFADLEQFVSQYQPDGSFTDYDITDAIFDGTIVAITPFDKNMRVASNGRALRFCLADRTVYLVRNNSHWASITVLSQ
ncbi:hypothetical protein [Arsukibacterium indicum]|uniref:DUF4440 domain-containing protein n=1 Tax=Arsukibacterium indicum TaxID=2848612 RepID=A0ABS6MJM2_9GAMM|nr:hypothetical protein [Arsukibacterium indicum]MBV2129020.1 hypothetical protein [Arsukibacterium indicum]